MNGGRKPKVSDADKICAQIARLTEAVHCLTRAIISKGNEEDQERIDELSRRLGMSIDQLEDVTSTEEDT